MSESFLRATVSIRAAVCTPRDTVLTIRRSSDGGWELPGGRIHESESIPDCLRRETAEETGLDVTVHHPVEATSWRNDADQGRLAVYYYCTAEQRAVSVSEEHTDAAWLDPDAATDRLSDPQTAAVERALSVHE